jgi:eukaryotic-like serine/threonine-protein kinase
VPRARTTSIVLAVLLAALSLAQLGAAQTIKPKPAAPIPLFPTAPIWTIDVSALPVAPPVAANGRLFLALASGVAAHALDDGKPLWQSPLEGVTGMAATDDRLIVGGKDGILALDAATGKTLWTYRSGTPTAPPLVHGEFLFVAVGEQLVCARLADGSTVWSRDIGAVEQRPAVEGARIYVPVADGRVVALEQASGETAWEFEIGVKPTEPLIHARHVFVGAEAKRFCSIKIDTGLQEWCYEVGAAIRGKPAADTLHVYFVGLDNFLRGLDLNNGAHRWKKDLRYRPSSGPILVGTSVAVPGSVPRVEIFDTVKRTTTTSVTLATRLATVPLLIDGTPGLPPRIAAVTGGLAKVWTVTLVGPAPPAPPPIADTPLTVLPGQVVAIGKPPTPPE